MTINRTSLLDLPLPVTGTESGTWGDVTNNGLTQYLDIAVAGRNALTSANFTAGGLTLSLTEGDASATNIAAGSAQYGTLYVSSLATNSTITAPASNRAYRVVNADSTYTLTVKASGQTGVTFPIGTSGTVVFNGTDYELLGSKTPAFTLGGTVTSNGQSFSGTIANLGTVTTADINGGTIDGTAIGGSTPAAGSFTNVNVTSATNPTAGMYLNSTASSGLSFYNTSAGGAGSSAMQIYYGRSTIAATTNGYANIDRQFFGFGRGNAPHITIPSDTSLYDFAGHDYLVTDVPYVMKIDSGGRGDNTGYTAPESNGVLYVKISPSYGGNAANGVNGVFVEVPRQGLGDANVNGIKVWNRNFGSPSRSFWAQLKPDDPNGGGAPVGFYAQIDTSNGPADNSGPVGLVVDNATTDNYAKINGGQSLAIFYDRRSGATSRPTLQFYRNTTANLVGSVSTTNTATAYNTSSDYRLKENVSPMTGALLKVAQLKPCTYTWKIDGSVGEGFIAHELQTVIPQAVTGEKDEVQEIKDDEGNVIDTKPKYQSMDTSFLVATLTAAIQELKAELDSAKQRISVLEAQ